MSGTDGGFDHVLDNWMQGSNGASTLVMRWEDQTSGGDRDFNDAVINATGLQATVAQTFSLAQGPAGAMIDSATGRLICSNPKAGNFRFVINVSDGIGGTAQQSFSLVVA